MVVLRTVEMQHFPGLSLIHVPKKRLQPYFLDPEHILFCLYIYMSICEFCKINFFRTKQFWDNLILPSKGPKWAGSVTGSGLKVGRMWEESVQK